MGYFRFPGRANDFLLSFLRSFVLSFLLIWAFSASARALATRLHFVVRDRRGVFGRWVAGGRYLARGFRSGRALRTDQRRSHHRLPGVRSGTAGRLVAVAEQPAGAMANPGRTAGVSA